MQKIICFGMDFLNLLCNSNGILMLKPILYFHLVLLLAAVLCAESKRNHPFGLHEDPTTGINIPKGFEIELLYEVDSKKYGSWVSITFDEQNRLTVSDQHDKGIFRLKVPELGKKLKEEHIEKLPLESSAYGLLYAFDHLYINRYTSIKRAKLNPDGSLGKEELVYRQGGRGEHGPHSMIVSEDGKNIYAIAGNYTEPSPYQKSRIIRNMETDLLLKHYKFGHNNYGTPPAGWVMKLSPDGKQKEMMSMGYRNPVDFALNRHGEMFVYDSDMEHDIGSPWYRPTRINHAISGAENGWRATTQKWRPYFADTVGSVVDIGPGCPTGVIFGTNAKFPTNYRDAMFICDWTYATMYSIHFTPKGSSYTAEKREFISNTKGPLALCDVEIGKDGHMYFTVGGRKGQSYLYRVSYQGKESTQLAPLDSRGSKERAIRHRLETYHCHEAPNALKDIWKHLDHDDYHIRYAARIALEWQTPKSWAEKAYSESSDLKAIHALLGLARTNYKNNLIPSLKRLNMVNFDNLDKEGKLALLRTYAVTMSRQGMPNETLRKRTGDILNSYFPSSDDNINEELCRVLSYLDHPMVVSKTIQLMKKTQAKTDQFDSEIMKRNNQYGDKILKSMKNAPNVLNMHFLFCLKEVQSGWSREDRKYYLTWVNDLLEKSGGSYYKEYVKRIRSTILEAVPEKEAFELQYLMGDVRKTDLSKLPNPKGPGRAWTVETALKSVGTDHVTKANLKNGEIMFQAGRCSVCHQLGQIGGGVGPILTHLGKRSDNKFILESILKPHDVVSDQYEQHEIILNDGSAILGRIVMEENDTLSIVQSGFAPEQITKIKLEDIQSKKTSKVSMMPPGLINGMNPKELRDLMGYLVSGGWVHDRYSKTKPVVKFE